MIKFPESEFAIKSIVGVALGKEAWRTREFAGDFRFLVESLTDAYSLNDGIYSEDEFVQRAVNESSLNNINEYFKHIGFDAEGSRRGLWSFASKHGAKYGQSPIMNVGDMTVSLRHESRITDVNPKNRSDILLALAHQTASLEALISRGINQTYAKAWTDAQRMKNLMYESAQVLYNWDSNWGELTLENVVNTASSKISSSKIRKSLVTSALVLASCTANETQIIKPTEIPQKAGTPVPEITPGVAPRSIDNAFGVEQGIVEVIEPSCNTSKDLCLMKAFDKDGKVVSQVVLFGASLDGVDDGKRLDGRSYAGRVEFQDGDGDGDPDIAKFVADIKLSADEVESVFASLMGTSTDDFEALLAQSRSSGNGISLEWTDTSGVLTVTLSVDGVVWKSVNPLKLLEIKDVQGNPLQLFDVNISSDGGFQLVVGPEGYVELTNGMYVAKVVQDYQEEIAKTENFTLASDEAGENAILYVRMQDGTVQPIEGIKILKDGTRVFTTAEGEKEIESWNFEGGKLSIVVDGKTYEYENGLIVERIMLTPEDWMTKIFVGDYTGSDNKIYNFEETFAKYVKIYDDADEVRGLEVGTPIVTLESNGVITCYAHPEVAARVIENGGLVLVRSSADAATPKLICTLGIRAAGVQHSKQNGIKIKVRFGESPSRDGVFQMGMSFSYDGALPWEVVNDEIRTPYIEQPLHYKLVMSDGTNIEPTMPQGSLDWYSEVINTPGCTGVAIYSN